MSFLKRIPDLPLAMTLLWMWCVVVLLVVVTYFLVRWWRRRHPPARRPDERPYAQQLQRRLAEARQGKTDQVASGGARVEALRRRLRKAINKEHQ